MVVLVVVLRQVGPRVSAVRVAMVVPVGRVRTGARVLVSPVARAAMAVPVVRLVLVAAVVRPRQVAVVVRRVMPVSAAVVVLVGTVGRVQVRPRMGRPVWPAPLAVVKWCGGGCRQVVRRAVVVRAVMVVPVGRVRAAAPVREPPGYGRRWRHRRYRWCWWHSRFHSQWQFGRYCG